MNNPFKGIILLLSVLLPYTLSSMVLAQTTISFTSLAPGTQLSKQLSAQGIVFETLPGRLSGVVRNVGGTVVARFDDNPTGCEFCSSGMLIRFASPHKKIVVRVGVDKAIAPTHFTLVLSDSGGQPVVQNDVMLPPPTNFADLGASAPLRNVVSLQIDTTTPNSGSPLLVQTITIDDREFSASSWAISQSTCSLNWQGSATTATQHECYTDWHWRSASALSVCPGREKSGALCYDSCKEGYDGVGPVCWKRCPSGYADDGAVCRRNAHIISADNSACPWYDKCGLTFSRGCSKCPNGYHNDGCTCRIDVDIFAKDSYWRGVGSVMSCPSGTDQIGLLCYGSCPSGYKASGIYCNADKQTCQDVPVQQPPDLAALKPHCFVLKFPDSSARPCIGYATNADSDERANQLAKCECQGQKCDIQSIDCAVVNSGNACN